MQGRVRVDGESVRELGSTVDPSRASITVDGEPVRLERPVHVLLNKPRGIVCTNFPGERKPRAIDLVSGIRQRIYTVGRLDEHSEGLVLLTNDGELANRIAHPRYGMPKTYVVSVVGSVTESSLARMLEGVWLAEGKSAADRVFVVRRGREATVLSITLREGRNREIRRVLARLGHKVTRLKRVAIGPLTLRGLSPGRWRFLERGEVEALKSGRPLLDPRARRLERRHLRRGERRAERPVSLELRPPLGPRKRRRP